MVTSKHTLTHTETHKYTKTHTDNPGGTHRHTYIRDTDTQRHTKTHTHTPKEPLLVLPNLQLSRCSRKSSLPIFWHLSQQQWGRFPREGVRQGGERESGKGSFGGIPR